MPDVGSFTVNLGLRGLATAQTGLARLGSSLASAGRIAALGVAGITAVGAAAATVVVPAVKLAASAESLGVAMRVMVGDAEEAKRVLAELREVGAKTPLQFQELAQAAKSLIAFGQPTENVTDQLVRLGNIAVGIGEPLNEIAVIFGKARVQGRLFAEDVNQLVGRGIPVIQEFAKQLGVSDSAVKQMVSEGRIGFENLERAIVSLTSEGGKFQGLMEEMSTTAEGLYSTLKDNINEELRELGEKILPTVKAALKEVNEALDDANEKGGGAAGEARKSNTREGLGALGQGAKTLFLTGQALVSNLIANTARAPSVLTGGAIGSGLRSFGDELQASARETYKDALDSGRMSRGLPPATSDEVIRMLDRIGDNTDPDRMGRQPLTVGR